MFIVKTVSISLINWIVWNACVRLFLAICRLILFSVHLIVCMYIRLTEITKLYCNFYNCFVCWICSHESIVSYSCVVIKINQHFKKNFDFFFTFRHRIGISSGQIAFASTIWISISVFVYQFELCQTPKNLCEFFIAFFSKFKCVFENNMPRSNFVTTFALFAYIWLCVESFTCHTVAAHAKISYDCRQSTHCWPVG